MKVNDIYNQVKHIYQNVGGIVLFCNWIKWGRVESLSGLNVKQCAPTTNNNAYFPCDCFIFNG